MSDAGGTGESAGSDPPAADDAHPFDEVDATDHARVSARRLVRSLLWLGVSLFWLVQLTLALVVGMPLLDTVLLALLLAVVPVLSLAQLPLIAGETIERLPAYWSSIVTLWLLGTVCWLVGTRERGAEALGVVGLPPVPFFAWTVALTVAGLAIIVVFRSLALRTRTPDSPVLRELLPRTRTERRVFALLSLVAGVGEELAYRGYVIPMLAPLVGTGGAAVVSSAVFGVVHGYQGALGVVRTGLMGGVLAWGFLASGSLWPAIAAHALIDLVAGLVLGERLLSPGASSGVDDQPQASPTHDP